MRPTPRTETICALLPQSGSVPHYGSADILLPHRLEGYRNISFFRKSYKSSGVCALG